MISGGEGQFGFGRGRLGDCQQRQTCEGTGDEEDHIVHWEKLWINSH